MNQTIPPLDYRAGLVAFGSGSCLDGKDAKVLYGSDLLSQGRAGSRLGFAQVRGRSEPHERRHQNQPR